jgi:hypothetical protein
MQQVSGQETQMSENIGVPLDSALVTVAENDVHIGSLRLIGSQDTISHITSVMLRAGIQFTSTSTRPSRDDHGLGDERTGSLLFRATVFTITPHDS